MSLALIKTKFYIPSLRPTHIVRPRLKEMLNHELVQAGEFSRKLTLICAPAGYGKTSLTIDWLSSLDLPAVWLSLDSNDNDPVRFLTYLINAFRQVLPEVGGPSLAMLQSPQLPDPESLLVPLLNEIEVSDQPLILVIDDYHLIESPSIHQYLNFLMDYQPAKLHTVIASREDPPLPLHRLRGRGQLVELRQENLRFTEEETNQFLKRILGKELSSESIQAIEHRTEGWVTGMQLLALSLQNHPDATDFIRSFTGSDRFILDYLFEEVFHHQDEAVQDFLVKTAILENLCAGLCETVTGRADSGEIIHSLDQSNLFVHHLDHSQTWFRYHRLFLDLLKHRLRTEYGEDQHVLHLKASHWYEENGYLEEAVSHALAGSDWNRGLALIYEASDQMLKSGAVMTMLRWFSKIPVESILAKPEYCLTYAWPLLLASQLNESEMFLNTAEELAAGQPKLLGEIAAAQAFLAQSKGNEQQMVRYSERALSLMPKTDVSSRSVVAMNLGIAYWHYGEMEKAEQRLNEAATAARQGGNKYAELTALFFIGRVHAVRGHLRQAAGIFNSILDLQARMPIIGLVYLDVSMLQYELNDLDKAEQTLEKGIEFIGEKGNQEFRVAGLFQKARFMTARGQQEAALVLLEECGRMNTSDDFPIRTRVRLASCIVETALACGNLALAESWAETASAGSDAHPFYRFLSLTPVRLWMAKGQMSQAAEDLKASVAKAEEKGWGYGLVYLHILQSMTAPNLDTAIEYLKKALSLAHLEGFIRTFIDRGESLIPVLREAARRGLYPEYVGQILSSYETQSEHGNLPPDVEPLSERELEVLHLLAAGLTNRQIADQLFVSVSTIKSHVHHISGKLQVSNRTQAVAKARQLGLL